MKSASHETILAKPHSFTRRNMIFGRYRKLHFIGIGGAGMSGMAETLLDLGYSITGSDNTPTDVTEHLIQRGIRIQFSHEAANVRDAHLVVISAAVKPDNPEVTEARRLGIPVIKRAEMLGELMRLKFSIGIAGAHGKTSTTALVGHILKHAGVDPTVIVGGRVTDASIGAKIGAGDYLVAEADEFDRSFLVMYPSIAVVTNLEEDHRDIYENLDDLKDAFVEYCNRTPFYGQIILNADDPRLMSIAPRMRRPVVTFAVNAEADYQARNIQLTETGIQYTLFRKGDAIGNISAHLPGMYNVYNTLCASTVALELDIAFEKVADSFSSFGGVLRRFEFKGEAAGRVVYDDYAHHPTECRRALEAAKAMGRPVTVIFQPHLFSRTRDFAADFAEALSIADYVYLVDIYPARELPMPGITTELIQKSARGHGYKNFTYVGPLDKVAETVVPKLAPNALVMTMGAGNVFRACGEIIKRLKG